MDAIMKDVGREDWNQIIVSPSCLATELPTVTELMCVSKGSDNQCIMQIRGVSERKEFGGGTGRLLTGNRRQRAVVTPAAILQL